MLPWGSLGVLCEVAVNGSWGWSHQEDQLDASLSESLVFPFDLKVFPHGLLVWFLHMVTSVG